MSTSSTAKAPENGKATLERFTGGWNFEAAGSLAYAVTEDRLVITVPRAALGLESDTFTLAFKWSDNAQADGDVMDFYSSGDTAPGGRFKYVFTAAPAQTASETVAADTDSTQAPVTETESETGTSSGGCRSAVPALMPLAAAAACAFPARQTPPGRYTGSLRHYRAIHAWHTCLRLFRHTSQKFLSVALLQPANFCIV
ncbi:MAG: hypothetical protein L6V84_01070 [Oscillospiraceae bacterium]|nr:MAG: hypothetical protein L6V84_01070 [Oscillospiraceae bacterium]